MAGGTRSRYVDPQPDRILIVVNPGLNDFQHKAPCRSFVQERVSGTVQVMCFARHDCQPQRLRVHSAQHQDLAGVRIAGDTGH